MAAVRREKTSTFKVVFIGVKRGFLFKLPLFLQLLKISKVLHYIVGNTFLFMIQQEWSLHQQEVPEFPNNFGFLQNFHFLKIAAYS